jgi:predicted amidohydrolase
MHAQARTHQIHLAGTLMLREGDEIYNAAFVIAPDGRQWRYDKHYPWLWERAYFRSGPHQEIAKTDLGDLGMMICWDAAHPEMWAQYAGQVDALLIMSCPPKMSSPDLVFPDGKRVPQRELGGIYATAHTGEEFFPGIDLDEQTGWLGVPAVATVGGGKVKLKFSRPYLAMSSFLMLRPDLWGRFRQAKEVFLEVGFDRQTKVVNAAGEVISRVEANGDGYSVTEMILTDQKPTPQKAQPAMRTPPIARYISDKFGEWFLRGLYKKGVAATKPQRPT